MVYSLHSDGRYDDEYLSNYAYINLQNELLKIDGVGKISIMGAGEYAMRIWLRPRRAEVLRHPRERGDGRRRTAGRHLPCRPVRGRTGSRGDDLYLYGDPSAADRHGRGVRRDRRADHPDGRADPPARPGRRVARQPDLRGQLAFRGRPYGAAGGLPAAREQRRGRGQCREGHCRASLGALPRGDRGHGHGGRHAEHRRRHPRHLPHADHRPAAGRGHHLPLHPGLARDDHPARGYSRLAHRRLRALPAARLLDQHHLAAGTGTGDRPGGR